MSLTRFLARCNRYDPAHYLPFTIDDRILGHIRQDRAAQWRGQPQLDITATRVALRAEAPDFAARTTALDSLCASLIAAGLLPPLRGERYAVVEKFADPPLAALDRAVVPMFGVASFGVHLNGYVETASGLELWVGRRAPDKPVAPGKLDNLVAGGQPIGLDLMSNLVKECAEEADIPEAQARTARPTGAIRYRLAHDEGLRVDTLFCFDLALSETFVPRNTDGEIDGFFRWPVAQTLHRLRTSDDFKFNVNLVLIDFFIRHGIITPDEPDYLDLISGLHR